MNSIVTCPYDDKHRIRKDILPYHLVRCSRNNFSLNKKQCPFDACHIIDDAYFQHHIVNCASSGNIRSLIYNLEPPCELGTIPLESVRNLSVPIMKDWIEESVETYDPWKSTENRNILRNKIGGSKSQKKQYKLAERKRIENLIGDYALKPSSTTHFKHRTIKQHPNVLQLIQNLKRLSLEDFDALLENLNLSDLYISDKETTLNKQKHTSQFINTMLSKTFEGMLLYCLKKSIS